jgi:hypothetical protein
MIDDDYTLDEGDEMPDVYWRVSSLLPLVIRTSSSRIATAPLVAFANEFYRLTDVFGARYLDLWDYTWHNAYLAEHSPNRVRFDTLVTAHPDTFSTVIGGNGPRAVWLALRLTRLTDAVADTILGVCTTTNP